MRAQTGQTSGGVADNAANAVHSSVDRLAEMANSAESTLRVGAQRIREGADQLMERERQMLEQARGVVGANPFTSIALALVSGLLIGWLIKGKD